MSRGRLFDPPPKPRRALMDQDIAQTISERLIKWGIEHRGFEREDFTAEDEAALTESLMATDSEVASINFGWLQRHRPKSCWACTWDDAFELLLVEQLRETCRQVLPLHQRLRD